MGDNGEEYSWVKNEAHLDVFKDLMPSSVAEGVRTLRTLVGS